MINCPHFAGNATYIPEGFQYADYFDTYWGDLATVGNWSEAQPLQCGDPATAHSVGDYLTVEDTPSSGYDRWDVRCRGEFTEHPLSDLRLVASWSSNRSGKSTTTSDSPRFRAS